MNINIEDKIDRIYDEVSCNYQNIQHNGLMNGKTGAILFFYYYWLLKKKKKIPIYDYATQLIELIEVENYDFSFAKGITGMGWLLSFFKNKGLLEMQDDYFEKLDDLIFSYSLKELERGNYDLLEGGIGGMLYFIERKNFKYLNRLYKNLIDLSILTPEGVTWIDGLEQLWFKRLKYDFGMAHGIPSILSALSFKPCKNKTDYALIYKTTNWLLQFEKKGEFPHSTKVERNSFPNYQHSGLAWCYGGLGISIALLNLGNRISNNFLIEKAQIIGQLNSNKMSIEETNILDACICHGSAGAYLMFNKLHQRFGGVSFNTAKTHWLNETIQFDNFGDVLSGFKSFNRVTSEWETDYSLLDGISGIGLVLISAISNLDTDWDRCLLLS